MELEDGFSQGRPCIAQRDEAVKSKRPVQLSVGDKVEVRSVDEGLLGSWHSGVVIECKNGSRKVQYDNVLCDDGSQRLDDCISVHPVVDGATSVGRKRLYYRSFIRPIPPPLNFDRLSVHYAQCVDAYYKEAWWEGVVFDYEKTSGVRSIFFPDIGDILQVGLEFLRITQDWDEYTRDWKPRGIWHFLQLIERFEQENLLHVSFRQIWYEVREKKTFQILKEWTNSIIRRDIWESLVREVIGDHSKLAAEKWCDEVVELMLTEEFELRSEKSAATDNENEILDLSQSRSKSAIHGEQFSSIQDLIRIANISNSNTTDAKKTNSAPTTLVSCIGNSTDECSGSKALNVVCEQVPTNKYRKRKWEVDIASVAEFGPDSVMEYHNSSRSKHKGLSSSLALNMRKHLTYLGWKVEITREDGRQRMRYTTPEGKTYMSLSTVCEDWGNIIEKKHICVPDIIEPVNVPESVENNALLGSGEKNENTERPVTAKPDDMEDEAKRHVKASDSVIRTNEAIKTFNSLTACETYANGEVDKSAKAAVISEPRQKTNVGEEGNDTLIASEISPTSILVEQSESGQVKSMMEGEHQHERINGVLHPTSSDNDAGAEVNDVSLVTEEEEIHVDILSLNSNTEEDGQKLNTSLSGSSSSATNVETFNGALLMNYNKSSGLQVSSPISDDFCPRISEGPAEKNNTGDDLGIVPKVKICADSIYNSNTEERTILDLFSSSDSQTTDEETPCSLPSILPCNAAGVDGFSKLKDLNVVDKELPEKKRRKRNWEIAGRDLVPEAAFCPSSVAEYQKSSTNKLNLRKHLVYLGWKIEVCREEGFPRMRYTSPDGKTYMSLATVCKDFDTRSDRCEEKKGRASPPSSHALISLPPSHAIVEPAYLSETVKYYGLLGSGKNNMNTWPRIAKPGIEDEENTHLMASESLICRNEAFMTFNSFTTACETYADGQVDSTADKAIISDPGKNIGKLIASESFPSSFMNEQVEVKSMLVGEHHYERINGFPPLTCNDDDDVGSEVNDVSLVTEKGEVDVDVYLSKSNTGLQGSYSISHDFCPHRSERSSGKRNYLGCPIAGNNVNIVPKAEISPRFIYKSKMEGGSRLNLTNISNFDPNFEETPSSLPSILPCNTARVDDFSRLKESNLVGKELPIKKKKLNWEIAGRDVPETKFCPDSVAEQKSSSFEHGKASPNLALDMRDHLVYPGWKVEHCREEGFSRMHYSSPDRKNQMLFATVRKEWNTITEQVEEKIVSTPTPSFHPLISLPSLHYIVQPTKIPEEEKNNITAFPNNANSKDVVDKRNRHLMNETGNQVPLDNFPSERPNNFVATAREAYADGEVNNGVGTALVSEPKQNIKVGNTIQRSLSDLPMYNVEFEKDKTLAAGKYHNEEADGVPPLTCKSLAQMEVKKTGGSENKEKKEFALLRSAKVSGSMDDGHCSERSVRPLDSSISFNGSQSILSLLIDKDVVLPHAKVYYRRKSGDLMKEGEITREGIKCNCCQNVFGLSKFEAHTGSNYHRPAANIFLEDGRSLSECQLQLRSHDNLVGMLTPPLQPKRNRDAIKNIAKPSPQPKGSCDKQKKIKTPSPLPKRSRRLSTNDCICSVCSLGGQLTFCDHCPSSFHVECLGLKVIPEDEWFCPSCCCGICGRNKFNNGAKKIMDGSMLNCYQCERQYHVGCLLNEGDTNLNRRSKGKWFCNRKCEQIFVGLRKLLGRPVVVGADNLTWTLLKYTPCDDGLDDDGMDLVETLNNLNLAVSVMQECFDPVKEPRTKKDIVKDVIFSRGSNLKRLNFQGFYTVLLSRDDDLISVAAVRVYGDKVAEVPLIGTRFEYRRHGMCRLLMNVLEKKLRELGVERLVFLATPSVLSTWTASFGFSKISESERFNLLSYTFLDFQGTATCHKNLTNSAQPTRTQQNFHNGVDKSDNADVKKNSLNSEVLQGEVEILHQRTAGVALSSTSIKM